LWVTENIDNLGKSKEAITLKRGLYTDIHHSEARDFYPLLPEVGKGVMQGEIMKAANENDADTAPSEGNDEAYSPSPSSSHERFGMRINLPSPCART
jgi:hypothetical protein